MSRTLIRRSMAAVALWCALGSSALSCGSDEQEGVGDPCIPEDEYQLGFSGYGLGEVSVETRSFQCETRVCLVNHFQGRVSCPAGQSATAVADGSGTCTTPDGQKVTVPVSAWNVSRPAQSSVYCSCRCAGSDPNASYCKCPSGFSCSRLIDDLGLGQKELAGSYCVRDGSEFRAEQAAAPTCSEQPNHPACAAGAP